MLTIGLVVLVIFLFLRKVWATVIPERGRAALAGRYVRHHVRARIQPRRPLADGADHCGRLCRRRRDRDDRERRAISRHGEPPLDAAIKGAGQIGFTIMSITLSLVAVFIPLLFMAESSVDCFANSR